MKFVCDRCQTRYSIADEKVRQKILRIRCKTCGNVIVVQGEHASASGGEAGAAGTSHIDGSAAAEHFEAAKTVVSSPHVASTDSAPRAAPTSAPKAAPSSAPKAAPASAPKAPPSSGLKVAPSVGPKAGAAGPPPPPVEDGPHPLGGRAEWYLAIAGVRSGPFVRTEVARKILATEPGKKVHVWKEGMPGWKRSEEVSVIARELSLLRPPRSPLLPPPPPPEPPKAPPSAAPPKVAAMPASAAKLAKAPEKQQPIFPGKPLGPGSATISDSGDFVVDTDPGLFADITTKKAKNINDLSKESGKDGFGDVTTQKGKNLWESALVSAPASAESDKTPPPVRPLPPVSVKAAARPSAPAISAKFPAAVSPPAPSASANLPAVVKLPAPSVSASYPAFAPAIHFPPASAATSSRSLPAVTAISAGQSDLGGFSEVIQAGAISEPPSSPQQVFPEIVTPPDSATFPSPSVSDFGKGPARPGKKYVVAAGAIVALVLLIVMVTLRMDSRKVPDIEPVPAAPTAPPVVEPPPKPAVVEPPKPEPAAHQEKTAQNVRSGGKRGFGKSSRHVEVALAPAHQPEPKPTSKPTEPHRPNPFDESKPSVSQSQISAVVRNKANQAGLKSCYERALKMDNRLTSGRIDVTVSVGTSGTVQRVVINAPASFILVEPCIKSAVKRWVFPPSSEEYGTNFPLIMQGGM
jgi:predicted Zn finger-like uncharacterized protein